MAIVNTMGLAHAGVEASSMAGYGAASGLVMLVPRL